MKIHMLTPTYKVLNNKEKTASIDPFVVSLPCQLFNIIHLYHYNTLNMSNIVLDECKYIR